MCGAVGVAALIIAITEADRTPAGTAPWSRWNCLAADRPPTELAVALAGVATVSPRRAPTRPRCGVGVVCSAGASPRPQNSAACVGPLRHVHVAHLGLCRPDHHDQ